ncbi:glycosyl hydrolase family 28 protein [Sodalis sp. RH22]|uniref:glycosyl hydrolase family 28 protein n=1 Tax=unclassified Sodalis (in: enterobacteria) TaxID=2636512 RepID=UPI0039B5F1F4
MPSNPLLDINNLSDVSDAVTARENLDVYDKAEVDNSSWDGRPGATIIDDTTERLELKLPSIVNPLSTDVRRLRDAFGGIDTFAATVLDFLILFIYPENFYQSEDGDNWQPALTRANAYAVANNRMLVIKRKYQVLSAWELISNTIIYATGGGGLFTLTDTPITLIRSSNATNLRIIGLDIDGGVTAAITSKNSTRAIRFINVNGLSLSGCSAGNSADWCLSIETCESVRIYDTTIYGGGRGQSGGRDGIHLLDSSDVVIDRADIESGDDCIGITSEYVGTKNITVRRIVGKSDIGSVVIYNEEKPGGTYASMPCSNLDISDVKTKGDDTVRDVVRVIKYGANSVIDDVAICKVRGSAYSHALYVSGVTKLRHRDIQVHSTQAHGIYITNCEDVEGDAEGSSDVATTTFQGVSIYNSSHIYAKYSSRGSNGFGMQLNGVTKSVIKPFCINCGAGLFASNSGGGARVVNSTDVILSEGILDGDDGITYVGLSTGGGGNNNLIRGAGLIVKGSALPNYGLADGSPPENGIDLNMIYTTTIGRVLAAPINAPFDSGTWFLTAIGYYVANNNSYRTRQVLYGYGTSGSNYDALYSRVYNGKSWSLWKQFTLT